MTNYGEDIKELKNIEDDDFLVFVLKTPSGHEFLDLKGVRVRQTGQNKEYTLIVSQR